MKRLPEVVLALNIEVTRLTRKKPMDAIKDKSIDAKSSTTYSRPVGFKEKRSDSSKNVYAVSEPEGDQRRVTDPIWSLKVFNIEKLLVKKGEPVLYCLKDGQSVVSSEKSFRLFLPELSYLLKEFVDLKKLLKHGDC